MAALKTHVQKVTRKRKAAELAHRAQLHQERARTSAAAELAQAAANVAKMPSAATRPPIPGGTP